MREDLNCKMNSGYLIQPALKTHCNNCGAPVWLLCNKDMPRHSPAFYICFNCRRTTQIGVGIVREEILYDATYSQMVV